MNQNRSKDNEARNILGISQDASDIQIKKSFWLLAMKYHPDKNPDNHDKFIKILNAYKYLLGKSDLQKEDSSDNEWKYFCWWRDNYF